MLSIRNSEGMRFVKIERKELLEDVPIVKYRHKRKVFQRESSIVHALCGAAYNKAKIKLNETYDKLRTTGYKKYSTV